MSSTNAILLCFDIFAFIWGAVIGSFLNVVVWRVPRGESISHPGSHCPKCGHRIRPWENIPVISWLFLRGRCSQCHLPISWHYPAGEAAVGLLFWALWHKTISAGLPVSTVLGWWWLAAAMLTCARIDIAHRIIPDAVTLPSFIVAVLLSLGFPAGRPAIAGLNMPTAILWPDTMLQTICGALPAPWGMHAAALTDCLAGALGGALIIAAVRFLGKYYLNHLQRKGITPLPPEAMGLGDLKLVAVIGAFTGLTSCIHIIACGALLATVWGIAASFHRPQRRLSQLPFAPFLGAAALLRLLLL